MDLEQAAKDHVISPDFAKQVQAELDKLEARVDALEDRLHKIRNWCMAYPVEVFIPPTKDEIAASVDAMKAPGCASSEAMHGSWARHILNGLIALADIDTKERS